MTQLRNHSVLCVLLYFLKLLFCQTVQTECDFYIAPSKFLDNGIGIFAGRKYSIHDKTPAGVTVRISQDYKNLQLSSFIYEAGIGDYKRAKFLEFGPSSLYNYHESFNLQHEPVFFYSNFSYKKQILSESRTYQHAEANTIYPHFLYSTITEVLPGEEFYRSYDTNWIDSRGIENIKISTKQQSSYDSINSLKQFGHCVSNVYTNRSKIKSQESSGQGVFASVNFKKGDLVDVSPVLILPKSLVKQESDQYSVLINFCFSRPGSDVALLPLGYTAVCNHGGKEKANVEIKWHFWGGIFNESVLKIDPKELLHSDFAKLYFGYHALRNINKGEEILIDYGEDWESDWEKYLQEKRDHVYFQTSLPLFRRTIDLPTSMFSKNWFVDCISMFCRNQSNIDAENILSEEDEYYEDVIYDPIILHFTTTLNETVDIYYEEEIVAVLRLGNEHEDVFLESFPGHEFVAKINGIDVQTYYVLDDEHQWFNITTNQNTLDSISHEVASSKTEL